jgi:glyoxylase-like metal-dependent hydrolase (beta-lactamase superfamily II)
MKRIEKIEVEYLPDNDPDLSWLGEFRDGRSKFYPAFDGKSADEIAQDRERLETYGHTWHCIGIRAVAEVVSSTGTIHKLSSGGLWGIESDSGADYLEEVAKEELSALADELRDFGFSEEEISLALEDVEMPA